MSKSSNRKTGWRNSIVLAAGLAIVGGSAAWLLGSQSADAADIVVYKDPNCGCCRKWVDYMRDAGYSVEARNTRNLPAIKAEQGVPNQARSCHTAIVAGYFIEGHVPAADVRRLLSERPDIRGLSAPGMPVGSPGMEVPGQAPQPYQVLAIGSDGTATVFASH
jgi:hypothetical protein